MALHRLGRGHLFTVRELRQKAEHSLTDLSREHGRLDNWNYVLLCECVNVESVSNEDGQRRLRLRRPQPHAGVSEKGARCSQFSLRCKGLIGPLQRAHFAQEKQRINEASAHRKGVAG